MVSKRDAYALAEEIADEVLKELLRNDPARTQSTLARLDQVIASLPRDLAWPRPLKLVRLEHRSYFGKAATAWMQKHFAAGERAGALAMKCEDELWARRTEGNDAPSCVGSDAAWVVISCLADGGERARARTLSFAILDERMRLDARIEHARLRTEMLFVAMLGNFSDDPEHDAGAYRRIHSLIRTQLDGEPRTGNLHWAYAAYEAEYGESTRALAHLARAFSAAPHLRAVTVRERCFQRLREDERLVALTDPNTNTRQLTTDPFVLQFESTVESLLTSEDWHTRTFEACLIGDLLVDVNGGVLPVQDGLRSLAEQAARERTARGEDAYWCAAGQTPFLHFMKELWAGLAAERTLFAVRAEAIAWRLAKSAPTLIPPLQLLAEAEKKGWSEPAAILLRALERHRAEFADPTLPIGSAYLPVPSAADGADGFYAEFWRPEHLKEAGMRKAGRRIGPILTLADPPGTGELHREGTSGGYGFAIRESYHHRAVHGTLNSPWHDGQDYSEAIAWPLWVGRCLNTIADSTTTATAKPDRRKKGKRRP